MQKVSLEDVILFNRQLASMIKIDLPLPECLERISALMGKRKISKVLEEIIKDVRNGWSFSSAVGRQKMFFPPLYLNMIRAGEETGNLARVLYQLIQHFQEIAILNMRVRNALIYPAILITTSLITLIFILTVTVPSFVSVFDSFGAALPLPTRIVINVSMFIKENILIFGFGLVIIFLLIIILSRIESLKPAIDRIKLKIPFVGKLLRDYSIFHFCRTLGDLLTAGVPIIEALALSKGVLGNRIAQLAVDRVQQEVIEGGTISKPLEESAFFPATLIWMMKIGERRGDLDRVLIEIGDAYHQQVKTSSDLITKHIEPVLIFFLGSIIGFIVIAMYLPIFKVSGILE